MTETRLNFTLLCSQCKADGRSTTMHFDGQTVNDGALYIRLACPVCGFEELARVEFGPIRATDPQNVKHIPAPCGVCGDRRQFVRASHKSRQLIEAGTECRGCKAAGLAEITCHANPAEALTVPALFRSPVAEYDQARRVVMETPGLRRLPAAQIDAIADLLALHAPSRPRILVDIDNPARLGAALRELRLRRRLMLKEVARAVGVSVPTVCEAETPRSDHIRVSLKTLLAIASFYGVELVFAPSNHKEDPRV